jgi:hypothetical protein
VEPRYGRLYANAVVRPLAEQLIGVLGVVAGERVCDLMCDGGMLGMALGAAVGRHGAVVLVDTDDVLLQRVAREVSGTGCAVSTRIATGSTVALAEPPCDRVASLCTFGFWEDASMLDVAERALRPSGRAAVLTWDEAQPPLHEVALVDALCDAAGITSPFLARCLASPDPVKAAHWERVTLQDVVCFDGIAGYWAAMVGERPLAAELLGESEATLRDIRAACERALKADTAADGTLRIPVRATLWCCSREASA